MMRKWWHGWSVLNLGKHLPQELEGYLHWGAWWNDTWHFISSAFQSWGKESAARCFQETCHSLQPLAACSTQCDRNCNYVMIIPIKWGFLLIGRFSAEMLVFSILQSLFGRKSFTTLSFYSRLPVDTISVAKEIKYKKWRSGDPQIN